MAIGQASDFTIYQEEFHTGFTETIEQVTQLFNTASANTVLLQARNLMGDYEKNTIFKAIASLVTRRDTTSVAAATDLALEQIENASVKLNRKIGPVAQTLDAFRKVGKDAGEFSFVLGQQMAEAVAQDWVNSSVGSAAIALDNIAALKHDATAGTLTHGGLVTGLSKRGDKANEVAAWVMHSKPFYDLMGQSITDKITNVADVTIVDGNVATLGKPTIVTDCPDLLISGSPDNYLTLGLVEAGIVVTESEGREIFNDIVTGLEQIVMRIQGEYAFNVGLRGFTWDITNGGANPNDATLKTASNWDQTSTDTKSMAGVLVRSQ